MAQALVSRSSKGLFTRQRVLVSTLELLWPPQVVAEGQFHTLANDVGGCREVLSNYLLFRRPQWFRGSPNGKAVTTSAASVNDELSIKFDDAPAVKPVVAEKTKVLEGDGHMKQARILPVPLHVTANASIGNSRP